MGAEKITPEATLQEKADYISTQNKRLNMLREDILFLSVNNTSGKSSIHFIQISEKYGVEHVFEDAKNMTMKMLFDLEKQLETELNSLIK